MATIAENIKRIRTNKAGMTQEEFGKLAGVSSMAVSQWENGRAVPRMGAVEKIASALNISKSEIIDGSVATRPVAAMKTNLQAIRKARGYSNAADFAAVMGMPEKTYRNYEQGVSGISLDLACEFADALGCTLDELAGRAPAQAAQGESELIADYRACSPRHRARLLDDARDFACMSKNGGHAVSRFGAVSI